MDAMKFSISPLLDELRFFYRPPINCFKRKKGAELGEYIDSLIIEPMKHFKFTTTPIRMPIEKL